MATAAGLIALSTFVITASIVGVLALVNGAAADLGDHMPYYVLVAAITFTAMEVAFEFQLDDPIKIISTSAVLGISSLVGITLTVEGILYGLANPTLVVSRLIVYIIAAGLISTGLIFWAVRHWRELTRKTPTRRTNPPL